jgi:hypothetical protein
VKLSDLTVEVRDKNLVRIGAIRHEELSLELEDQFNNVGTWKLSLPVEHPLTPYLRMPGSGIIVTGPTDVLMSGPTTKNEFASTPEDPAGSVSFEGISDTHILSDMLAFPQPDQPDPEQQKSSHDVRSGSAEYVMHGFVNANVGPLAPAERRRGNLVMGPNLNRGPQVTKSARFPVLGNLLTEIALLGSLGFRVVQRGDSLQFETFQIVDRSREIRLDVRNGNLAGQRVSIEPPGVTRAIVAGQGEMVDRQFLAVDTPTSLAAEAEWGRRIERFIDQRNTDDWNELQQAGDEAMEEDGFTKVAVQAVTMEDSSMRFGIDWYLGDKVGVVVNDQELTAPVTGMVMKADSDGFRVGALLGDAVGFDREAAVNKRVRAAEKRVSSLERNGGGENPTDAVMRVMGVW